MWLKSKSITEETPFPPETGPDGTLFVRYKESMKAKEKDSNRYDIWNMPSHMSNVVPVVEDKVCSVASTLASTFRQL